MLDWCTGCFLVWRSSVACVSWFGSPGFCCCLTVIVPTFYCCILAVFIDPSTHGFVPQFLYPPPFPCPSLSGTLTQWTHMHMYIYVWPYVSPYLSVWVLVIRVCLRSFTHPVANSLLTVILVHCAADGSWNEGTARIRIPNIFKRSQAPKITWVHMTICSLKNCRL